MLLLQKHVLESRLKALYTVLVCTCRRVRLDIRLAVKKTAATLASMAEPLPTPIPVVVENDAIDCVLTTVASRAEDATPQKGRATLEQLALPSGQVCNAPL